MVFIEKSTKFDICFSTRTILKVIDKIYIQTCLLEIIFYQIVSQIFVACW